MKIKEMITLLVLSDGQSKAGSLFRHVIDWSFTPKPLISHRFDTDAAENAYQLITSSEDSLGILLEYIDTSTDTTQHTIKLTTIQKQKESLNGSKVIASFIGAGNYASSTLIPFLNTHKSIFLVLPQVLASSTYLGKKYGFSELQRTQLTYSKIRVLILL